MQEIVVAGGGFAGLWASLAAVRELECAGATARVSLVSADPFLVIRPRLYEPDPEQMRVDLRPTLEPVGVRLITAVVTGVDSVERRLLLADGSLPFDRLVLATGSTLARPAIDGAEHMFDIDSYAGAIRLEQHLRNLGSARGAAARTVVILGGGFTGIELATELRSRLSSLWGETAGPVGASGARGGSRGDRAGSWCGTAAGDPGGVGGGSRRDAREYATTKPDAGECTAFRRGADPNGDRRADHGDAGKPPGRDTG